MSFINNINKTHVLLTTHVQRWIMIPHVRTQAVSFFFAPFNHVRLEALACAPRTCCGLSRRQFRGEDRNSNFAMDAEIDFCG